MVIINTMLGIPLMLIINQNRAPVHRSDCFLEVWGHFFFKPHSLKPYDIVSLGNIYWQLFFFGPLTHAAPAQEWGVNVVFTGRSVAHNGSSWPPSRRSQRGPPARLAVTWGCVWGQGGVGVGEQQWRRRSLRCAQPQSAGNSSVSLVPVSPLETTCLPLFCLLFLLWP